MPPLARPHLAVLLALVACTPSNGRQVVQSDDPIEVELSGQRGRLLDKAAKLERLGRTDAALTIYDSLVTLYPEDVDVRAARATARRALEEETSREEPADREGPPDPLEITAIDTGDDEHP